MKHLLGMIVILVSATVATATITVEGTAEEQKVINDAIAEIQKNSATATAIITGLKAAGAGAVTIKFGDTSDIATAEKGPPQVITLDKAAIAKMTQVGTGKALEQFGLPYLILHEGWHILHWSDTEAKTVSQINKARTERKSSKRTKYAPDELDKKLYLPFDDGSKVDVTAALKSGSGGTKAVDFWQWASLSLSGEATAEGGVSLSLLGETSQGMVLDLPPEYDGGTAPVDLLSLSVELEASDSDDFSLSVSSFEMVFSSFDLDGVPTGLNYINFYLDHQMPYGDWTYAGEGLAFDFQFSGDLGWSNDLFSEDFAMAYEQLIGTMSPTLDGWTGVCDLTGVKFAPIPEPATLALLALGGLALIRRRV